MELANVATILLNSLRSCPKHNNFVKYKIIFFLLIPSVFLSCYLSRAKFFVLQYLQVMTNMRSMFYKLKDDMGEQVY